MTTAEKFTTVGTDALDTAYALAGMHLEAAERFTSLTFDSTRSIIEDAIKDLTTLSSVTDPKSLIVAVAGMVEPTLMRGIGYVRGCYGIASDLGASVSGVMSSKYEAASKDLDAALDKLGASTPAGGDMVVSAVKTAMSAANAAIDEAAKATREVVGLAEANVNKATDAAVKAAAKAAKQVA